MCSTFLYCLILPLHLPHEEVTLLPLQVPKDLWGLPPSHPYAQILTHSPPATLAYLLFRHPIKLMPASGPLHLLFPLPILFLNQHSAQMSPP